jgi:hypothetical protein
MPAIVKIRQLELITAIPPTSRIDCAAQPAGRPQSQIPQWTAQERPTPYRLLVIASNREDRNFCGSVLMFMTLPAEPPHLAKSPTAASAYLVQGDLIAALSLASEFPQLRFPPLEESLQPMD